MLVFKTTNARVVVSTTITSGPALRRGQNSRSPTSSAPAEASTSSVQHAQASTSSVQPAEASTLSSSSATADASPSSLLDVRALIAKFIMTLNF